MHNERTRRRLAAIVAADVSGYSRLMGADEEGTFDALRAHRAQLIDPTVEKHGGRIVKTMGDGLLLEFPSVVDAVRCSIEVQRAMHDRNADVSPERRIDFRVGINVGDVITEGDDIFGDGVNIAARLEGIADPGGVCISEAALQHVGSALELVTEDMGERALKNIEAPIHAFRIRNTGGVEAKPSPIVRAIPEQALPLPSERPSLAILPFRSLNTNPDARFVADGIALGVQTLLVQLSGIFFVNACLHQGYREGRQTAAEALSDMAVRYAVEGSVQQVGGRVRVSVQVSDLEGGALVWAENYDRSLEDVFSMQDEISRRIAGALSTELVGGHLARDFTGSLDSPDAWEHFLRGIDHLYRWTKHDCAAAIPHFEALADAHPESAIGPCYLSLLNYYAANRNWTASKEKSLEEAERWAHIALPLEDGNNGLGHAVLGAITLAKHRHDESLAYCRSAVSYRANCPFAIGQLGLTETYSGDPASGVKHAREAMSVRMLQPSPLVNALAIAYRDQGEIDLSIPTAEEAARIDPNYSDALATLCSDFAISGESARAEQVAKRILAATPDFSVARFARQHPYRDAVILDRITSALMSAGLPS